VPGSSLAKRAALDVISNSALAKVALLIFVSDEPVDGKTALKF
jgi:hypothetical protein